MGERLTGSCWIQWELNSVFTQSGRVFNLREGTLEPRGLVAQFLQRES